MSLWYVVNLFSASVASQALLNRKTVFMLAPEGEGMFSPCVVIHSVLLEHKRYEPSKRLSLKGRQKDKFKESSFNFLYFKKKKKKDSFIVAELFDLIM